MSENTTADAIEIPVIETTAKYRVLVRHLAKQAGFRFSQKGSVDTFTKGEGDDKVKIVVHHGPTHLCTGAERTVGDLHEKADKSGKWFTVQAWINGSEAPFKGQLSEIEHLTYGKGLGLVRVTEKVEEDTEAES